MGCCFSNQKGLKNVSMALKLPNSKNYLLFNSTRNEHGVLRYDINKHISSMLFSEKNVSYTNWIVYNDQDHSGEHPTHAHAKGIVAWNAKCIMWFCHSIPHFPTTFDGKSIEEVAHSQLIFGQSLLFLTLSFSLDTLNNIKNQLNCMNVHVTSRSEKNILPILTPIFTSHEKRNKNGTLSEIIISNKIKHVAKSSVHHIDIYQNIFHQHKHYDGDKIYVETWRRGHQCPQTDNIIDVNKCHHIPSANVWYEHQDHAKWACTDDYYCVGDLNRMDSQFHRGGGMFVINDPNIALALKDLVH